jgi:serine/threonine protein kinase/tetratricopeptide (TPR) repeat protein
MNTPKGAKMIGQTISHYKILEKIGEGGMSVVYKAQDTTLGRLVALKFPSEQILADEAKKTRFVREAKAAAALDHPNICILHEIGQAQGKTFISMAYLDGQSLYEKIKVGPLNLDEAVDIAIQVAQGLYEAHEKGIVHRDIKTGNIMVTAKGDVKIMDFGIAKLASETTETRLTHQGAIMGTVEYMSPEQARGEPVDYRTDIWSLGVVIYEMLTGRLPFKGDKDPAVIHAILYEEPEKLRNFRREIPALLEQTVLMSMQKEPANRHENLGVLISRLRAIRRDYLTSSTPYKKSPSIAVLPFTDMSPEKDQEYFGDGMAEELINALTHVGDLHVIARTSAFAYKGKSVTVAEIGGDLNVETILEGSVRKAGNRLRITAQLVDTTNGHHLWSDRYDRDMDDVFAIQDEITSAIVDELKPKLLGQEKAKLAKRQTVELQAYQLYLKGRFFWNKRGAQNLEKAIEYFDKAIEEDINYAAAYAGLASSYMLIPIYRSVPPAEYVSKARDNALMALKINDSLAEAHASMGFIKVWYERDWDGADAHYKRAFELNPGYANTPHWQSQSFLFRGRFEEAVKEMERAFELDPVSVVINKDLATAYFFTGQLDRTIEFSTKALEIEPAMQFAHYHLGLVYLERSMYEEALEEFQKENQLQPYTPEVSNPLIVLTYMRMGKKELAKKFLEQAVEQSKQRYTPPYNLASLYFAIGDKDKGFEFLNKAYDEQDCWLIILKLGPVFETVRSDPRYIAMLKKMNLE